MEFKSVKVLDGSEEKGVAQVEEELLKKHEEEINQNIPAEEIIPVEESPTIEEDDLDEQKVLSYIGKRYNKQINSFDELVAERQESEPLPEDVAAYMKYKKETGRGFDDFLNLRKDYDSMDNDQLIKSYLSLTQEGLDDDDIDTLMDDYRYDEEIDDESRIKKIKIEKKKLVAEAKKFFNTQKEKYKIPLESSMGSVSEEEKEELEAYKQYVQKAKTIEEENSRKRQWFDQKTNEIFNGEFKGFEFNVNEKKIVFSPGDASELKKSQSTPANFINKFLDENGLIKDAVGYHRALAIAMNPEKFAKHFYEQGMADAKENTMKGIKNINMSEQKVPSAARINDGIQMKVINPDSGKNLKIKSVKRL
jgi:hypothetical protein